MGDVQDLGRASVLSGEAIGEPGQRRFRLCLVGETGQSAACWMEKEQLSALGEAIETVLKDQSYTYVPPPLDDVEEQPPFPLNPDIEFRVGRLSIGLDTEQQLIQVTAGDASDTDDPEGMEVRSTFSFAQGYELSQQVTEVVAAGRKPCPLCSAPMDPSGHVCVKQNGHRPQ